MLTRREALARAASAGATLAVAAPSAPPRPDETLRIGVISASIGGKPQKTNGHTWHFAQYLHMADAFRRMVKTRKEPVPHREILEVTAILHAGAKSLKERSRLVALAEVL